jgi:hypothetical protein
MAGAFFRLIGQALSQAFLVRCAAKTPILDLLLEKKIILLDGSDDGSVHPRVPLGLYRATNMTISNELMRHFVNTGKPLDTILVWEEAAATKTIGPFEINRILREGRKTGVHAHILTQDMQFASKEVMQVVRGCTRRKEFYNPYDDQLAIEMGSMIGYPQLDPNEIALEQEVEKQRRKEQPRKEKRKGKAMTYDADGKGRRTESETEQEVYDYETVIEKRVQLRSLDEQIKLKVQMLLIQPQGWRMTWQVTKSGSQVSKVPEAAIMLPDPYDDEDYPDLGEKKIAKAILLSQANDCFVTPVYSKPPCETKMEATPKKPAKKPNANPKGPHKPSAGRRRNP